MRDPEEWSPAPATGRHRIRLTDPLRHLLCLHLWHGSLRASDGLGTTRPVPSRAHESRSASLAICRLRSQPVSSVRRARRLSPSSATTSDLISRPCTFTGTKRSSGCFRHAPRRIELLCANGTRPMLSVFRVPLAMVVPQLAGRLVPLPPVASACSSLSARPGACRECAAAVGAP